ncbi:MAG: hypothetical protein FWH20_07600 [Oscillospiraceae bacterium]|nr:hypothetical protein [Oscillospiraceae bacterium]
MKKTMAIILIAAMALAVAIPAVAATTADALAILRHVAGGAELTAEQRAAAGIGADEAVTTAHALEILRSVAGGTAPANPVTTNEPTRDQRLIQATWHRIGSPNELAFYANFLPDGSGSFLGVRFTDWTSGDGKISFINANGELEVYDYHFEENILVITSLDETFSFENIGGMG